jgi:hypothetical protein
MNLNRIHKIILVTLFAAQSFLAAAQTNTAAAPLDYSTFTKFISDRNIFDPNRIPNRPWVKTPPRSIVTTPPPPRAPDSFSLVGIIGYGEGSLAGAYAFFNGSSLQYQKTTKLNGSIASFKVADIAADSVTLVSGTNKTILAIGEQLQDDGTGHWVFANGTTGRYNNVNTGYGRNQGRNNYNNNNYGGGRRRNNNYGGGNNGGNFNNNGNAGYGNNNNGNNGGGNFGRGRNNYVPANAADNSQSQDTGGQDFGGQPVIIMPQDFVAPPDDNTPPDQGGQNN